MSHAFQGLAYDTVPMIVGPLEGRAGLGGCPVRADARSRRPGRAAAAGVAGGPGRWGPARADPLCHGDALPRPGRAGADRVGRRARRGAGRGRAGGRAARPGGPRLPLHAARHGPRGTRHAGAARPTARWRPRPLSAPMRAGEARQHRAGDRRGKRAVAWTRGTTVASVGLYYPQRSPRGVTE